MFLAHFVMLRICSLSDGNTILYIHINTCHWWQIIFSPFSKPYLSPCLHVSMSRCLTTSGVHYLHFLLREGPDEGQCVISHYIFIKIYVYICVYVAHSIGLYGNSGKTVRTVKSPDTSHPRNTFCQTEIIKWTAVSLWRKLTSGWTDFIKINGPPCSDTSRSVEYIRNISQFLLFI